MVLLQVTAPQGVSLDFTAAKLREIEDAHRVPARLGRGDRALLDRRAGGADNSGFMIFTLAPWGERERSQQEIVDDISRAADSVIGSESTRCSRTRSTSAGRGRGCSSPSSAATSKRSAGRDGRRWSRRWRRTRTSARCRLSYETTQPQLFIKVDRARASDLGIDIDGLGEALQSVLDGRTIGSVFIDDRSYDVKLTSSTHPVRDPTDLENLFLQTRSGEMVPMSTVVTLEERAIAPELSREGQMRSVAITAGLTDGLPLAQAVRRGPGDRRAVAAARRAHRAAGRDRDARPDRQRPRR